MENSGVFNKQWKLRPIGPYHISALPRPKLSQDHAWVPKGEKWLRSHRKTAKNRAKKDWFNKENIIFLWLGRVSNRENINKRKRRPENICRKREVSGQNEKFGIPALFQASSAPSHRPGKEAELFTLDKQHREFLNGHQGSLHLRNKKHR